MICPKDMELHIWCPPKHLPVHFFIGLLLICILYDTIAILSIEFSGVVWVVLVNYQTWRDSENFWIYRQVCRSAGVLGPDGLQMVSELRPVLWRTVLLILGRQYQNYISILITQIPLLLTSYPDCFIICVLLLILPQYFSDISEEYICFLDHNIIINISEFNIDTIL